MSPVASQHRANQDYHRGGEDSRFNRKETWRRRVQQTRAALRGCRLRVSGLHKWIKWMEKPHTCLGCMRWYARSLTRVRSTSDTHSLLSVSLTFEIAHLWHLFKLRDISLSGRWHFEWSSEHIRRTARAAANVGKWLNNI